MKTILLGIALLCVTTASVGTEMDEINARIRALNEALKRQATQEVLKGQPPQEVRTSAFAETQHEADLRKCRIFNFSDQRMADCVTEIEAQRSPAGRAAAQEHERLWQAEKAHREATEAQCRKEITIFSLQSKQQQYVGCMVVAGYVPSSLSNGWVRQ